jgi:hypothetical protein
VRWNFSGSWNTSSQIPLSPITRTHCPGSGRIRDEAKM